MRFGVLKEGNNNETRVAMVPDTVKALIKKGHAVLVQSGAGVSASISDADFTAAGAQIVLDTAELFAQSDCLLRIKPYCASGANSLPQGKALIGFLAPSRNPEVVQGL